MAAQGFVGQAVDERLIVVFVLSDGDALASVRTAFDATTIADRVVILERSAGVVDTIGSALESVSAQEPGADVVGKVRVVCVDWQAGDGASRLVEAASGAVIVVLGGGEMLDLPDGPAAAVAELRTLNRAMCDVPTPAGEEVRVIVAGEAGADDIGTFAGQRARSLGIAAAAATPGPSSVAPVPFVVDLARVDPELHEAIGCFLTPAAHAINAARQDHLATLGLDLAEKTVLEVGAGIGLHTGFFEARGCDVLVTEGRAENVRAARQLAPHRMVELLDLEVDTPARFGQFDVVYCYGTLYHLHHAYEALEKLAAACRGQILLETCVSLGPESRVQLVQETDDYNQAVTGIGSRPTRRWVLDALRATFGYGYITATQPDFPDFQTDWDLPDCRVNYRAVFVGSKSPLENPNLLTYAPTYQRRVGH